jgi:exosortase family protein XrtF
MSWQEFKPTILFLSKFLAFYLVGNLLYGLFVTTFYPQPDPITKIVTRQTAWVLSKAGWPAYTVNRAEKPTTAIIYQSHSIVTVYEGCNGVNIMIIFMAFIVAFGPVQKAMYWFLLLGVLVIHFSNLFRIGLLFLVTIKMPTYLYFTHKYLFTAFIYGFVLLLWMVWVAWFSSKPTHAK